MRPLYLLLRILLPYIARIFYKKSRGLNCQKKFNAQTIFVSNHPSAFIDPLVAGNYQMPILYFVTRGDIFNWWLHPITWASQMVPIFRTAEDGADSHKKNLDSFRYLRKVLKRKKSLILFGEGYTDNTFIRSLKPLKKGPARIAFETMVESNWELDIKMQTLGINYTHPKYFRSDVLLAAGQVIHLKEYKELYEESAGKAISELTKTLQKSLQEQITYVENKELAPFVENLLILSRKGMNHFHTNSNVKLLDKYHYSQNVANRINDDFDLDEPKWKNLYEKVSSYFQLQKKLGLNENWVYSYSKNKKNNAGKNIFLFIISLPLVLIGLIHNFLPYLLIKKFAESTFKRDVFWSGIKLMVGAVIGGLYNLVFIYLFYDYIYPSYGLAILYYFTIPPLTLIFSYARINAFKDALRWRKAKIEILDSFNKKREGLLKEMKDLDLL